VRKFYKKVHEIKEVRSLNVTTTGQSLAVYLPKDLCDQYEIFAGDRVKVQFRAVYREVSETNDKKASD